MFKKISLVFVMIVTSFIVALHEQVPYYDRHVIEIDPTAQRCFTLGAATVENARGNNGKKKYDNQDSACVYAVQKPVRAESSEPNGVMGTIAQTFLGQTKEKKQEGGIFVVGVFDGHGEKGDVVSHLARLFVRNYCYTYFTGPFPTIVTADFLTLAHCVQSLFKSNEHAQHSGATACFAVMHGPLPAVTSTPISQEQAQTQEERESGLRVTSSTVYRVAFNNVGDSRALVIRNNQLVFATVDHKPTDYAEFTRIQKAGGFVHNGYAYDKEGKYGFALSRSWGDVFSHTHGVLSSIPDIYSFGFPARESNLLLPSAQEHSPYLYADDILVFATDGLWDVMSSAEVALYIVNESQTQQKLQEERKQQLIRSKQDVTFFNSDNVDLQKIADTLTQKARALGSKDDITVLIVKL